MNTVTLYVREECGGEDEITIEVHDGKDVTQAAEEALTDWVRNGDYGPEGGDITAWWADAAAPDEEHRVTVTVPPRVADLIREAAGHSPVCGQDDEDHDWTSQGEGGCDENPGVMAHGGTTISISAHCRRCGLHRTLVDRGSQRNAGESRYSYEYRMLSPGEIEHMREIGAMS